MNSPCLKEASEACFRRCCPVPYSPVSTESPTWHDFAASIASTLHPNAQFSNHESLPPLDQSLSSFVASCPQFSKTDRTDQIRTREYPHLSEQACLDYIGHGLFSSPIASSSSSSIKSTPPFFDISYKSTTLSSQISYGTKGTDDFESEVRTRIMSFMNLSETDYTMVFTANQTSAFKLIAESYPFRTNSNLLTVYDHKSEAIDALAETSRRRGARATSAVFSFPNLKIESSRMRKILIGKRKKKENRGLFVFPLQSRVTGARYSYRWMSLARENGWHVMLDTCALCPKEMETLGLSIFRPDFLFCSCFKVFGENPSGFGCLFIKKSTASIFKESATATSIGIVSLVPVGKSRTPQFDQERLLADEETEENSKSPKSPKSLIEMLRDDGYGSEDVKGKRVDQIESRSSGIEFDGLDHADSLGLIVISCRVRYLINWLVNALTSLKHPHSNEAHSLVRIYGPTVRFDRGPAVAFNVFDWKGERIDPTIVQKLADRNNISLSYGSLQHLTFSDRYEEVSEVKRKEKLVGEVSVVTVAVGFLTNFEDVYRVWSFVSRFLDADFVEKERWRYMALNQKTVEV